jgi:hypothetical protein
MEIGVFVVALVIAVGFGLLRLGRMPFPTRRTRRDEPVPATARTAEPPGQVDDSG